MSCVFCGKRLTGRQSRWCSQACRDHVRRDPARWERVLAAIARRPRCIICDAPIHYGRPGTRYDATTCGKRVCAVRRFDWYGPADPALRRREGHRRISRESMRRRRAA